MLVTLRIAMAYNNRNIENAWWNTMEFDYAGSINYGQVQTAFNDLITAWRTIHLAEVNFLQYTVSTVAEDSENYTPSSFVTIPLEGVGLRPRAGGVQPLATNVTYYIRKQLVNGRPGKLFLRGVLTKNDVDTRTDGKFVLANTSPLLGSGADWAAFENLTQPFYESAEGVPQMIVTYKAEGDMLNPRPVQALLVGGVKTLDEDYGWYNRGTNATEG